MSADSKWGGIAELSQEIADGVLSPDQIEYTLRRRVEPLLRECEHVCMRCEHPGLERILEEDWRK